MSEWRNKWKIEIDDCKDGIGHEFQDSLSDCIAEADIEVALLEAKLEAILCLECEKTMLECACDD